jgi:hypothetical protein
MKGYNRVMEIFWLSIGILIVLVVTFMGFKEGFDSWGAYYLFGIMALGTFLLRRYMRKRMEKHLKWLEAEKLKSKQ